MSPPLFLSNIRDIFHSNGLLKSQIFQRWALVGKMTCPSWSGMSRKPGAPLSTFTETENVSQTSFFHTPFELFALNQGCVLPKSWWKGSWPLFAVHRHWIMDSLSCVLGCGLLVDNRFRVSPKKLSFTKLSFWRSCFQLGRNTYDICDKSAQFGKTQFF